MYGVHTRSPAVSVWQCYKRKFILAAVECYRMLTAYIVSDDKLTCPASIASDNGIFLKTCGGSALHIRGHTGHVPSILG